MPRATWGQLKAFCRQFGYHEENRDHLYFDLGLPDGSSSGTMISHGAHDSDPIPKTLWKLIWHKQLRLQSENDFWSGLSDGPVHWAIPPTSLPPTPLPPYLQRFLAARRFYSEEQITQTSFEEAQAMYDEYISHQESGT